MRVNLENPVVLFVTRNLLVATKGIEASSLAVKYQFVVLDCDERIQTFLEDSKPDIIIGDLSCGEKMDFAFLKWLKERCSFRDIPYIQVASPEIVAKGRNPYKGYLGQPDIYVNGPVDWVEIDSILQRMIAAMNYDASASGNWDI